MTRQCRFFNSICLGIFLIAGGLISATLKYELLFDFIQYHYYNGFAFLNNRLMTDIAASALPTYYNPLLDSFFFLLNQVFKENMSIYYFITGLPFGALMFVFFKIALLFFNPAKTGGKLCLALCLSIALTGYDVWFQIGTSTHEIPVSVFILTAVYLLLEFPEKTPAYFTAGLCLGAAAGLKLTAAVYCLSTGLTLILLYKSLDRPKTFIATLAAGGLTGYLAVNGFWAAVLWQNFENPVFPFWNKIFKSPYYPDFNYVDMLHLYNLKWYEQLFLPFYLILHPYDSKIGVCADVSDIRFALVFIIGFIRIVLLALKKAPVLSRRMRFFSLWLFISYIIWNLSSANLRFTIPIETGCAIILVSAGWYLKKSGNIFKEIFFLSFLSILTGILLLTPFLSYKWGNRQTGFLLEEKITLPAGTLLVTAGLPTAAFAAEIAERNENIKLLGFTDEYPKAHWKKWDIAKYGKMKEKTAGLLNTTTSKIALIVKHVYQETPQLLALLPFDTAGWNCRPVEISQDVVRLFIGSRLSPPELCFPPEMKEKIIIEK